MSAAQSPPLFVAMEPAGAAALAPATLLAWACARERGVARAPDLAAGARRIAELAGTHALHLGDPLFDAPRLEALFAEAGVGRPPKARDWLAALAPFGQARHLAAMMEAAAARADPGNPAERLYETWREAQARRARGDAQPSR